MLTHRLPVVNQTPRMGRYNPVVVHRCLSEASGKNSFADKAAGAEKVFSPKKNRCFTQKGGTRWSLAVGGPWQQAGLWVSSVMGMLRAEATRRCRDSATLPSFCLQMSPSPWPVGAGLFCRGRLAHSPFD